MITAVETMAGMLAEPQHWQIPHMDFVDDLRRHRNPAAIRDPFEVKDARFAALLASTIEALCRELGWTPPAWVRAVPALREPWFVSGFESLKAITLVECPASFRVRNVFVMANFLVRV